MQVDDGLGDLGQHVGVGLEELVAGVALEDLEEVLSGVAVTAVADPVQDLAGPVADDGDVHDRGRVCRGSEEPEEAVLAGDVARCVEGLDPDVVEVDGPVDRGARVRLGDDEQLAVTGPGLGRRAEAREGRRSGGVVAQQPEARSGHRVQDRLAAIVAEDVLAVTEEGEVVGGQPVEESHPLGHLGAIDACRRCGAQPVADLDAPLTHLRPVLDGVADVAEQALQLGGQRVSVGRVAHPVDLDVHPRLDPDTEFARRSLVDVEDLLKHATSIPADDQLRVNEQVDAQAPAGQRHSHRVDEERHVVDDDLDRRVPRTPALRLDRGVVDEHARRADRPIMGEVEV
ncbi:MAG: hypothetical protein BWY91_02007 [bacterium ADurb.BinA028]|nr:MAG: hypothetical protein BWY91_02007 [bacterium ADurb.BinA028]